MNAPAPSPPAAPVDEDELDRERRARLLPGRLLGTLISAVFALIGLMTIWTQHYYGRSTKHGLLEVNRDGPPAIALGLMQIAFGAMPLGLWGRNGKQAGTWAAVCALIGFAALVLGIRLSK